LPNLWPKSCLCRGLGRRPAWSSKRARPWCWAPKNWRASIRDQSSIALGLKSACFFPLVARERLLGTLNVGRFPERAFTQDDVDFLRQVASQVALAADNALDYYQVAESRQRLAESVSTERRDPPRAELRGDRRSSAALKNVLNKWHRGADGFHRLDSGRDRTVRNSSRGHP